MNDGRGCYTKAWKLRPGQRSSPVLRPILKQHVYPLAQISDPLLYLQVAMLVPERLHISFLELTVRRKNLSLLQCPRQNFVKLDEKMPFDQPQKKTFQARNK